MVILKVASTLRGSQEEEKKWSLAYYFYKKKTNIMTKFNKILFGNHSINGKTKNWKQKNIERPNSFLFSS